MIFLLQTSNLAQGADLMNDNNAMCASTNTPHFVNCISRVCVIQYLLIKVWIVEEYFGWYGALSNFTGN